MNITGTYDLSALHSPRVLKCFASTDNAFPLKSIVERKAHCIKSIIYWVLLAKCFVSHLADKGIRGSRVSFVKVTFTWSVYPTILFILTGQCLACMASHLLCMRYRRKSHKCIVLYWLGSALWLHWPSFALHINYGQYRQGAGVPINWMTDQHT